MKRIALAVTLAVIAVPGLAGAETVSLSEYRSLVRESKDFLEQQEVSEAEAKMLALRFRNITGIEMSDGRRFPVDTKGEAGALGAVSGTTPDKLLRARFDALDEQLNRGAAFGGKDPQQLAQGIVSDSEFASSQPKKKGREWDFSQWPKWAQPIGRALEPVGEWFKKQFSNFGKWFGRAMDKMFRAISRFFRWMFRKFPQQKWAWNPKNPFASLGSTVLLVLYFLAVVAAFVGGYFLLRFGYDTYLVRTGRKKHVGALGGDLDLTDEGITDPLGTAQERALQGDYRAAIRLTYIAALWRLGDSGALKLEKNRTNWEYQRALRKKSVALHDQLLPATRLFDRVWYGKQKGTQSEFETVSNIYKNLPAEFIDPHAEEETPIVTGANISEGSAV